MALKKLMIASIALGMITPSSALAGNLTKANYDESFADEPITTVSELSDVKPTDWAYEALSNLVDRYSCIEGYPNRTFRGDKPLTRWEFAAGLNACMNSMERYVQQGYATKADVATLQRLAKQFQVELAALGAKVDNLEGRVSFLENHQFSTTTKLKGQTFISINGIPGAVNSSNQKVGNTAINYSTQLSLDTSFTGKDLLRARLNANNYSSNSAFISNGSLFQLDNGNSKGGTANAVLIDRLYYQFPLAKTFTVTVAGAIQNNDMAWIPSVYDSHLLNFFDVAGAPGVYNKANGSGFGVQYAPKSGYGLIAGVNYVAQNGSNASLGEFNSASGLNLVGQIGYRAPQYGIAFGYRYGTAGSNVLIFNGTSTTSGFLSTGQTSSGYAVNAYWKPKTTKSIIPSISGGYNWNNVSGPYVSGGPNNSRSWFAGVEWSDVFKEGNAAGVAVGQPGNYQNISANATVVEAFYRYNVNNNISVTPGIFYISNNQALGNQNGSVGGVIQTQFNF